jgi:hypothetical protein
MIIDPELLRKYVVLDQACLPLELEMACFFVVSHLHWRTSTPR